MMKEKSKNSWWEKKIMKILVNKISNQEFLKAIDTLLDYLLQ